MRFDKQIEINIGGEPRLFKATMWQFQKISEYAQKDLEWMANPYKKEIVLAYICLDHKGNKLPKDFDEEMVAEWLETVSDEERESLIQFLEEALGFFYLDTIARNKKAEVKMEEMTKKLKEMGLLES